jgi:hypothetical protein
MNGQDETTTQAAKVGRACRQAGCPCQDARIISYRRAGFVAVVARQQGETADRQIAPEPGWRLPGATPAD